MKKLVTLAASVAISLGVCAAPFASAISSPGTDNPLKSILGGLGKSNSDGDGSGSDSGLSDALGGLVSGLISNDKIEPSKLVGTWAYNEPAVCFKSDNFLQKAGGSAVAGTIEGKLAPYYKKAGMEKLTLTVDEDQKFTMAVGKLKVSGTVSIEDTDVYFNFAALGKISLGKIKTYVTMSGSKQMSVMFDVSKLVSIIQTVGSATGSSALNSVNSLLSSYDGVCAGFKLSKQ